MSELNVNIFSRFNIFFFLSSLLILVFAYILTSSVPQNEYVGHDIRAMFTGGLMVQKSVAGGFYDLPTQFKWQKTIFNLSAQNQLMPFLNPPFVALAFSFLNLSSLKWAFITFAIINTGILLTCLYLLIRNTFQTKYLSLALLCIFFLPIYITIVQGQVSFFIFLSLILSWYFYKKGRSLLAGASLCLLLIHPQLIFMPFLLLFWKRQWRSLFGLLLSSGILGAISLIMVGFAGLKRYSGLLFTLSSWGDAYTVHPRIEPTLRGFLQLIYNTDLLSPIILPLAIGILITGVSLFFVFKGNLATKTNKFDVQWALMIIAMLLVSMHTNYHDLIILLFPCVIFLRFIGNYLFFNITIILIDFILIVLGVPVVSQPLLAPFMVLLYVLLVRKLYPINNKVALK